MTDLNAIVASMNGMAQKQQLVRRGVTDHDLTRAVRAGEVVRVRNGWYSTRAENDPELRAVRVGGRLTGISAIHSWGGWVLGDHPLHVAVNRNSARLRTQQNRHARLNVEAPRGVLLHWEERAMASRGSATMVAMLDALHRVACDESLETTVAAFDWAMHANLIDRIDFESLILSMPEERRGLRDWIDIDCESLPESLARTRLRLAGHKVESQVTLANGQRIDLVVDGVVGVEVDGRQHHLTRFEYDRGKDVEITIDHKHALRPSANMVFHHWSRFALAVDTALADRGLTIEKSGIPSRQRSTFPGISGFR